MSIYVKSLSFLSRKAAIFGLSALQAQSAQVPELLLQKLTGAQLSWKALTSTAQQGLCLEEANSL